MSAPQDFAAGMAAYLEKCKQEAAGGLTVAELGDLLTGAVALGVQLAEALGNPGPEKKAIVLAAVGSVFDALADLAVPFYLQPIWLLIKPAARAIMLAIVSGAIERFIPLVRAAK
jgi:hypothetical protein